MCTYISVETHIFLKWISLADKIRSRKKRRSVLRSSYGRRGERERKNKERGERERTKEGEKERKRKGRERKREEGGREKASKLLHSS